MTLQAAHFGGSRFHRISPGKPPNKLTKPATSTSPWRGEGGTNRNPELYNIITLNAQLSLGEREREREANKQDSVTLTQENGRK